MTIPPNDSAVWPLARLGVVAAVAIVAVSVGYRDGWVTRADLPIVLAIAASLAGFDGVKWFAVRGRSAGGPLEGDAPRKPAPPPPPPPKW